MVNGNVKLVFRRADGSLQSYEKAKEGTKVTYEIDDRFQTLASEQVMKSAIFFGVSFPHSLVIISRNHCPLKRTQAKFIVLDGFDYEHFVILMNEKHKFDEILAEFAVGYQLITTSIEMPFDAGHTIFLPKPLALQ